MSDHLLEVKNLAVAFHTSGGMVKAVNGISYHLDRGETLAVLGESGSGKSVQASAIMGILDIPPAEITGGEIVFDGIDLLDIETETRRDLNGRRMAMIFQDTLAHLNPVYTIGWQIKEALTAHGHPSGEAEREARALLKRVGIPEPDRRFSDYPHQFSGGQRQRVMIAMALAMKPDLLIADEPTTALDVTVQAQILALLRDLKDEMGMGLLLISHDLGVVAETADRVIVMNKGEIVEAGSVREVFRNPSHAYTKKLIAAIPGTAALKHAEINEREVLLSVKNLKKYYAVTKGMLRRDTGQVVKACDEISFDLHKGETIGIVGESGSGKTTLSRTILRLEEPTGGEATYRGVHIFTLEGAELLAWRRQLQVVFQDPFASLNPRMNVFQLISEPWQIHAGVLPKSEWKTRVLELMDQVRLVPEHLERYPHQFSGGQRQRIAIARALALNPEVIICDEAVSALDVSIQAQVIELLAELRDRLGLSYLFIAHDLPVVRDIADRVLVMKSGKVVEQGTVQQIFDNPQHPYTQALLAASPRAEVA